MPCGRDVDNVSELDLLESVINYILCYHWIGIERVIAGTVYPIKLSLSLRDEFDDQRFI